MDLEVLALIGAMVWTAISLLKHLKAGNYGDALTLVTAVGVGIGVAFLVQAAGRAFVGDNAAEVVLNGYAATSAIRVLYEFKKSLDTNDTAKEPKLFENAP